MALLLASMAVRAHAQSATVPPEIEALLRQKAYKEAEASVRQTLRKSPNWETGYLLLGQIGNATGRYKAAEDAGLEALRIRPSVAAYMIEAIATMHLQRLNDSITWLEKAAALRPDNPEVYRMLALDYALGGMMAEAETACRRGLALQPDNWVLHYLDGRVLFELGRYPESQQALTKATELNPQSVRPWTALGQTHEMLGDFAGAEANYAKAVERCGASAACAWPLMQMGFLRGRIKGEKDAEPYFRRSIAARPDWAKPHFYLGKSLMASSSLKEAEKEFETAIRLDDTKSDYHYQLARLYVRLGRSAEAQREMSRYQTLARMEQSRKSTLESDAP